MIRSLMTLFVAGLVSAVSTARGDDWYTKAVSSVTMTVSPAEVRPGQVVTLKLTVALNDPYHTYPLVQPDRNAKSQVNIIDWPAPSASGLIVVGQPKDPANPRKKAEPLLGIRELHTFGGSVTFERTAVVSPKAAAGKLDVKLPKFVLMVCDETNCYPAKTLTPSATLTIANGPAVDVPAEHQAAVEAVLAGKK
jgi:hypothetical protein